MTTAPGYAARAAPPLPTLGHVVHVQPVLFGGTDDEANLQALCGACNLSKGAA